MQIFSSNQFETLETRRQPTRTTSEPSELAKDGTIIITAFRKFCK